MIMDGELKTNNSVSFRFTTASDSTTGIFFIFVYKHFSTLSLIISVITIINTYMLFDFCLPVLLPIYLPGTSVLTFREKNADLPLCSEIALVTNSSKGNVGDFEVTLALVSAMGVEVQFDPSSATVKIVHDDTPGNYKYYHNIMSELLKLIIWLIYTVTLI